jgi:hypothetical protein
VFHGARVWKFAACGGAWWWISPESAAGVFYGANKDNGDVRFQQSCERELYRTM